MFVTIVGRETEIKYKQTLNVEESLGIISVVANHWIFVQNLYDRNMRLKK